VRQACLVELLFMFADQCLYGYVHTAAEFGCQFTFKCLIAFCTHTVQGVTTVFYILSNSRKIQVETTAFTEILCRVRNRTEQLVVNDVF